MRRIARDRGNILLVSDKLAGGAHIVPALTLPDPRIALGPAADQRMTVCVPRERTHAVAVDTA